MAYERVKQFKDLIWDYEAVAGATLKVYTDLPGGGAPVLRRTVSLPATTARQSYTSPLDNPSLLEGTLIKFRVESTGIVRLYGGVVRLRPVGVYFDGSQNEVWETQELGFGN